MFMIAFCASVCKQLGRLLIHTFSFVQIMSCLGARFQFLFSIRVQVAHRSTMFRAPVFNSEARVGMQHAHVLVIQRVVTAAIVFDVIIGIGLGTGTEMHAVQDSCSNLGRPSMVC